MRCLSCCEQGVASADVHVRARAINQAFALTKRGLVAHPLLYGMILFSRTLGADPHLIPAAPGVDAPRSRASRPADRATS